MNDEYFKHWLGIYYTAGVKHLCEQAEAFWLLDAIASYQPYAPAKDEEFQVWTLRVFPGRVATLLMDDGNNHQLIKQQIEYTDFPHEGDAPTEVELWLVGPAPRIVLLPCEY